ncbi:MAG TPA: TRAP transporter fused permease subunit, partial [Rhabdaerophilum sp.]|nr:TRAP transporter fused permease subunit [Rhabdaerophilum sp.]
MTDAKSPIGDLDLKKAQELEESLDHEIRFRPLLPRTAWLVAALLLALSLFHYYTAGFGLLPEVTHRGIHLAFVIGLIFLVFPAFKSKVAYMPEASLLRPMGIHVLDWALFLAAVASSLYVPWIFHDLVFRVGNPGTVDVIMGSLAILVLIEATRRAIGWPLPIIAILLMLYAMAGPSLPGIFAHPGNSWKSIVNHLYLTSQGVYGIALGVVATYVFHYVLFGVLATRVGLGKLFIDLAMALAGRFSGGPAKVSIFASGLFGMISGSSIANTVTVGSLTIPMMIRIGYPRHFAGAVESTAATGGQITPPIMGAAAFLMVEFLNLPYQTIIIAAIVPAAMHFFGVFCQVHFEAKKLGLKGVAQADLPRAWDVIREGWPSITPLVVLLAVLLSGYTPYLAAFWGITACMVVGLTDRNKLVSVALLLIMVALISTGLIVTAGGTAVGFGFSALASAYFVLKDGKANGLLRVAGLTDAFVTGAKYAIGVGAAAATVGIIIGVVTLTGVGFKLSIVITGAAQAVAGGVGALLP